MSKPDPFTPIGDGAATHQAKGSAAWSIIMPAPVDAPAPPAKHFKLGKSSAQWTYTNPAGAVLGYVLRFNVPGEKQFRPLTLWRRGSAGKHEWRWESWPPERPLYGLQQLAERPLAPVVICEGEKATDAAARLLTGFVVVTSPNGAKSAGKADWSPLRGRSVIVWPDADVAGLEYAQAVVKAVKGVGAKSVAMIAPPAGVPLGWDAADAAADGWDGARAAALVAAAQDASIEAGSPSEPDNHGAAGGGRRRTPQRDTLIGLTEFLRTLARRGPHRLRDLRGELTPGTLASALA